MISEGDYVIFFYGKKKWLIKVEKGKRIHTHIGIIDVDNIIGKPYGISLETNKGKIVYALKPTIYDFIMKMDRLTQIVYPKDLGYIVARTGLSSGDKVIEIGTGSGALTLFLASIVKPTGHVYTYDINEEFVSIARKNIAKVGLEEYVTFNIKDVRDIYDIMDADLIIVDLAEPWTVIDFVKRALKESKMMVSICPTMNQAEKLSKELKKGFIDIECDEILVREIEAREGMTRPVFRMVAHTAYLVFARRLYDASR